MQCANHTDAAAAAYCSDCGKALCLECISPDKSLVLCAECGQEREAPAFRTSTDPSTRESFWKRFSVPLYRDPRLSLLPAGVSLLLGFIPEWVDLQWRLLQSFSAGLGFGSWFLCQVRVKRETLARFSES
jgi:hypothetical protein